MTRNFSSSDNASRYVSPPKDFSADDFPAMDMEAAATSKIEEGGEGDDPEASPLSASGAALPVSVALVEAFNGFSGSIEPPR